MDTKLLVASEKAFLRFLLTCASPLQSFFDHPGTTHEFCNRQGLSILRNDGFGEYADFLQSYGRELDLGVIWADKGWKNAHHYYDPATGRGLWPFASALRVFDIYYQTALYFASQSKFDKAVFFVGAAAHLVQDLCVPHHARAKLLDGHKQFEIWVQERCAGYAVIDRGVYCEDRPAALLLAANANAAADYFDWVRHEGDMTRFHQVAAAMLANAQRTTAGLLRHFAEEAAKAGGGHRYYERLKLAVA